MTETPDTNTRNNTIFMLCAAAFAQNKSATITTDDAEFITAEYAGQLDGYDAENFLKFKLTYGVSTYFIVARKSEIVKSILSGAVGQEFPDLSDLGDCMFNALMYDLETQQDPEPVRFQKPKNIRTLFNDEVRSVLRGETPGTGIAFFEDVTVAWRVQPGANFIEIAVAVCSKDDVKDEFIGARTAWRRLVNGEKVSLPLQNLRPAALVSKMFAYHTEAFEANKKWKMEKEISAVRQKYGYSAYHF